jgi:mRNA-decapping enzyme subunit 2|eukprot:jgi/Chrpa1/14303/Chrysochromulina_OHIO_Genome00021977-RA
MATHGSVDDVIPDAATLGEPPKLEEVLDDLAMRFVVNCPAEELESFERMLFQVELAFWFYEDQYKEIWPSAFPTFNLFTFAQQLFKTCPMLKNFAPQTKQIYDAFMKYKMSIPTCGAILLNSNSTKVLLIKSWNGTNWGFPKGKIDKDEEKLECAVREVLEEVGYDISEWVDPDLYIEHQWQEQTVRLYVVPGVPDDTVFQTRTKKEISEIAWHKIKDIPTTREDSGKGGAKFWMAVPFANKLRRLLAEQKKSGKGGAAAQKKAPATAPALPQVTAPPSAEVPSTAPRQGKQKQSKQQPAAAEPSAQPAPSDGGRAPANAAPLGLGAQRRASKPKAGASHANGAAAPFMAPPSSNVQILLRTGAGGGGSAVAVPSHRHPFLNFAFDRQGLVDALTGDGAPTLEIR